MKNFNMFSKNKVKFTKVLIASVLAIGFVFGVVSAIPAEAASCSLSIVSPKDGATISATSALSIQVKIDCTGGYRVGKFTYNINSIIGTAQTYTISPTIDSAYVTLPSISANAIAAAANTYPGQYVPLTVTFHVCTSDTGSCTSQFVAYDRTISIKFPSKTTPPDTTPKTDPLSVSCSASPSSIQEGSSTTFKATVSGGKPSYQYSWSGNASGNSSSSSKYFYSSGNYSATVTVTDSNGSSKSATCYVSVSEKYVPPTPPPTQPTYGYECNDYTHACSYVVNGRFGNNLDSCLRACQEPYNPPPTQPPYVPPTQPPYVPPTQPPYNPPTPYGYTCNAQARSCSYVANGQYSSLTSCLDVCAPQRYSCTNAVTSQCSLDPNGAYASEADCKLVCKPAPAPKYSCNQLTYQCITDTNGGYTDPGTCQSFCQRPNLTPTVVINSNPSTIDRGQTSVLTWSSTNASTCTASSNWSGSKNIYGQENVNPYTTSTYVITCYNSSGASASASTIVNVRDNAPAVDINVYPSTIYRGQTAMLSWSSLNAYNCTGSSTNNVWTGSKANSGSEQTSPANTTTYTITCLGNNGGTVSDWVTLNVNDVTSQTLTLNKLGRNLSSGDNSYRDIIRVTAGDVIEFYLQVDNLTSAQSLNTTIVDTLPAELSYRPGSTKVDNIAWQDGITSGGLNLGTLNSGAKKIITFQALANRSTSLFAVTNIANVRSDNNNSVSDTATVTYSSVAGASIVATGPAETMLMIFGGTSSITAGAWYFLKKSRKGKAFFDKFQENVIKNQINKFRVK